MFHFQEDDRPATMAEADAEYVRNVGSVRPEAAWILSDRDVWYRNPAYRGPAVPHPEDDAEYGPGLHMEPNDTTKPLSFDMSGDIEF